MFAGKQTKDVTYLQKCWDVGRGRNCLNLLLSELAKSQLSYWKAQCASVSFRYYIVDSKMFSAVK